MGLPFNKGNKMHIVKTEVFYFNELSEKAKEKARENYLYHSFEYFWNEENADTLNTFESIFPIKIKSYAYGYENYINYEFTEIEEIRELKGIRLLKYLYNNYDNVLFRPKFLSKYIIGSENNITGSAKILKENSCVLTGYCIDDDILEPIYQFLKKPREYTNFEDLMKKCLNAWISACNKDYEYHQSDEFISEHLTINAYEFDENGNRFQIGY